jgi:hypothetical protein
VTLWHQIVRRTAAVRRAARTCAIALASVAGGTMLQSGQAFAQRAGSAGTIPGVAYTIRVASQPRSGTGLAAAAADAAESYVGHAVFAANRGRLDIVEGAAEPTLGAGDYILFDTTAVVVVHPQTREFTIVRRDSSLNDLDRLNALGVTVTLSDVKVQLDSLGPSDTIAGIPTTHYRMTTAFNMSVAAAAMVQRMGTEAVTDYWVAVVPGLPNNPLLRANGIPGGAGMTGLFRDLERRVDSASARMGKAVTLRSKTVTRLIEGPGSSATVEQTSEVSDVVRRLVDEDLLMLPPDYKYRPPPGAAADTVLDAGAKWRRPPR